MFAPARYLIFSPSIANDLWSKPSILASFFKCLDTEALLSTISLHMLFISAGEKNSFSIKYPFELNSFFVVHVFSSAFIIVNESVYWECFSKIFFTLSKSSLVSIPKNNFSGNFRPVNLSPKDLFKTILSYIFSNMFKIIFRFILIKTLQQPFNLNKFCTKTFRPKRIFHIFWFCRHIFQIIFFPYMF